jgi:bacteriophage N4 adsorption protein B
MMELARMAWGELLLCVASFYCIFGLEDLALDILWGVMQASRWWQARVKAPRIMEHSAPAKPPPAPSFIAVFIPAWDESAVIAQMLAHTQVAWRTPNHIIYLGVYPNDAATLKAAQSLQHPRLRIVQCAKPGPTTKADCLNTLWQALLHDETQSGTTAKAVLLHDAEDVVHPLELEQINALADEYALVQFPVLPLWEKGQRWVGGHYGDEFARHSPCGFGLGRHCQQRGWAAPLAMLCWSR